MVLYSKFAYGSQFSGEKKQFKSPIIGCRDIKQNPSLILFGTPCRYQGLCKNDDHLKNKANSKLKTNQTHTHTCTRTHTHIRSLQFPTLYFDLSNI